MAIDGVSVRRFVPARREQVFEAWTRPDLMARWFFPGEGWTVEVTSDLRVGGRYEVAMCDADGGRHTQFGEYREIVPVSRLVFTWSCPERSVVDSVVTVELVDHGERTELRLTHDLPPDPKIRRSHEDGWVRCLGNLETMLSHGFTARTDPTVWRIEGEKLYLFNDTAMRDNWVSQLGDGVIHRGEQAWTARPRR